MHRLPQELTDYIIDFMTPTLSSGYLSSQRHGSIAAATPPVRDIIDKYFKLTDLGPADLATPCKYAKRLMFLWTSGPSRLLSC